MAASTVVAAFRELRDRGLVDDREYLRLCYRFLGEVVNLDAILAAGEKAGKVKDLNPNDRWQPGRKIERPADVKIGKDGEGKWAAAI